MKTLIGVLALQGDFREHIKMLEKCGIEAREIRLPEDLEGVQGLIIPGGESTAIAKLMNEYGFPERIKEFADGGKPVFGTGAGLIVLANKVDGKKQDLLDLIELDVAPNAYGRQIESREVDLKIHSLGKKPFHAVFIRAPQIAQTGPKIKQLAHCQGNVVLARQGNILVGTFHPELTGDCRLHQYFIRMVEESSSGSGL